MIKNAVVIPERIIIDQNQYASLTSIYTSNKLIPLVCSCNRENLEFCSTQGSFHERNVEKGSYSGFLFAGRDDDDFQRLAFKKLRTQSENSGAVSTVGMIMLTSTASYRRSSNEGSGYGRESVLYLAAVWCSRKSQRLRTRQSSMKSSPSIRKQTQKPPVCMEQVDSSAAGPYETCSGVRSRDEKLLRYCSEFASVFRSMWMPMWKDDPTRS